MNTNRYKYNLNQRYALLLMLIVVACFFMIPGLAHAQATPPMAGISDWEASAFGPPADISIKFMRAVFGEEIVNKKFAAVGGPATLIGNIFFVFNAALFVLGAGWLVVSSIMLVADSANEGEPLGKNANSLWLPIRAGAGIFGMLPAFGGFSLAQVIVITAASWGIGVANIGLNAIVDATSGMQSVMPNFAMTDGNEGTLTSDLKTATRGMFLSAACAGMTNGSPLLTSRITPRKISYGYETGWDFGTCGRVTIKRRPSTDLRLNEGWDSMTSFRVAGVNYKEIGDATQSAAIAQLDVIKQRVVPLGDAWGRSYWKDASTGAQTDVDLIKQAQDTYTQLEQVTADSRAALSGRIAEAGRSKSSGIKDQLIQNIKAEGWIGLGQWYSVFAETGAAVADAQRAFEIVYKPGAQIDALQDRQIGSTGKSLRDFLRTIETIQQQKTAKDFTDDTCLTNDGNVIGECSLGQSIATALMNAVAKDSGGAGLVNPVIASKNLGDYMSWIGLAGIAIDVAAPIIPGVGAVTKAIGVAAPGLGELYKTLCYLFIGVGLFLSVWIPMSVFLGWFAGVMTWILGLTKGVAMAQLWAFSHLKTKGDEFATDAARKGYIFLINMFLRPILMVIGFIAGSAAMIFAGTIFLSAFGHAMASAQGNSTTGLLAIAVYFILFCFGMQQLIQSCVNLTHTLPDAVAGYIGGQEEHTNDKLLAAAVGSKIAAMQGPAGGLGAAAKGAAGPTAKE